MGNRKFFSSRVIGLMMAALVSAPLTSLASDLDMQVEEPASLNPPPIDPAKEKGTWVRKTASRGQAPGIPLNKTEKKALEERRYEVEAMASRIREKREALAGSSQKERAERVRDLEALILEGVNRGPDSRNLQHLEDILEHKRRVDEKKLERKLERKLEKLEKDSHGKEPKDKPGKAGK